MYVTICDGSLKDLVILLHSGTRHTVNDGVPSGIHVADGQTDGDEREQQGDTKPEDDVEDYRVIFAVVAGKVVLCFLQC